MKKKTLKYTQCLKTYEIELTWDLFIRGLNECMEYFFYYKELVIDIAFHYEGAKKVYELNITNGENCTHFQFDSVNDLIFYKAFDNKSLYDIWEELEN